MSLASLLAIMVLNRVHQFRRALGWGAIGVTCCLLVACQPDVAPPAAEQPTAPVPSVSTPTPQPAATASPSPVFQSVVSALKAETKVPILLPKTVAESDRLYATVTTAAATSYEVALDYAPDCRGATACRWGSLAGAVATPRAQIVEGKSVALQNGSMADFVDAVCGASCSDSTLTWDQEGYRYRVALKAGKEQTLVDLANSAIANGAL